MSQRTRVSGILKNLVQSAQTRLSAWAERRRLTTILLICFSIRLVVSPFFGHQGDIADLWYYGFTLFYAGINPVIYFNQYGVGPLYYTMLYFWPYLLVPTQAVHALLSKIPLILCETAVTGIVFLLTRSKTRALAMAIAPISFLSTAIHGQIDIFVAFFLLGAIALLVSRRYMVSSLFLALSLCFKYIALPAVPILLIHIWRQGALGSSWTSGFRACLRYGATTALLLFVFYLPFFVGQTGAPLLLSFLGSSFASTGVGTWRGFSLNIWEYLRLDLQISQPSFILFYAPLAAIVLLVSVRTVNERPSSMISPIIQLFLVFYLTYPGIHMQNLLWAYPFLLLIDRTGLPTILYNLSFLPRFFSRNLANYVLSDVRSLLGLEASGENDLVLMTFGYFWFTSIMIVLFFWCAITRWQSTHIMHMPALKIPRRRVPLMTLVLSITLVVVLLASMVPSSSYESSNRWLYDDGTISMRHIIIDNVNVTGVASLMLPVDDAIYSGYTRDFTTCILLIQATTNSTASVYLNGNLLSENNTSRFEILVPLSLIQEVNNLTVESNSWLIHRIELYLLYDFNEQTPFYIENPLLPIAAAISAGVLLVLCDPAIASRVLVQRKSNGSIVDEGTVRDS